MTTITADLRLRLLVSGSAALPVHADFSFDPSDGYTLHVTFHAAGDTVAWMFSRDLLAAGLRDDAGLGDVRVWPSSDAAVQVVYISLRSPEGEALLEASIPELSAFLERTYILVPAGTECTDVDAAIARIFAES